MFPHSMFFFPLCNMATGITNCALIVRFEKRKIKKGTQGECHERKREREREICAVCIVYPRLGLGLSDLRRIAQYGNWMHIMKK